MSKIILEVDATDLLKESRRLALVMTPEQMNTAMRRVYRRTGGHVRKVLKKDLPRQYNVKAGEVGKAVRNAQVQSSGTGIGCIIPVVGVRKSIGGKGKTNGFPASGGAHGWKIRRKYKVKSKIVRSNVSVLPYHVPSYGGMPPFRNLSAPDLHGVTFTREGKERFPIKKVSGIAIPQMPTNRSADDVQNDIRVYLQDRIDHEIRFIIGGK